MKEVIKVDARALNDEYVIHKQYFAAFNLQRNAYYNLRDNIPSYLKTCADNVELVIYVDDVLEQPIHVRAGKGENGVAITIRIDGTLAVKWTKETCSYEIKIKEVNVEAVDNIIQMFMHRLLDFEAQRQGFFDARDKIHNLVKICSDNVKIVIFVDGVLDKSIAICAGEMQNVVHITIQTSGIVTHNWMKKSWKKHVYDDGELMLNTSRRIIELIGHIVNIGGRLIPQQC